MGAVDDLARPAGDDDVVGGKRARLVASPASTEEAAALIADARGLAVVVRGNGTKIRWGAAPRELDLIVDTRRMTGIVEHAAGDLITIVRAGTPLAGLDLGDQTLPLDGPPGATVGGTVSAATSGPRRLHYGSVRDLLIGITVVRPDGKIAHAGGKVVKNVAGYDLGKLYTGAYGTLGLITECVFRLHPRPAAALFVRAKAAPGAIAAVLAARAAPAALEVDSAGGELVALLEGTPAGVRGRAERLARTLAGEVTEAAPAWWGDYYGGPITVKLSVPISKVDDLVAGDVPVRGSAGTGVLYAAVRERAEVDLLRRSSSGAGGHAIVLDAPDDVRDTLDLWGPVPGLDLMRRVKDRFDPGHRFAPGRFAGGI